MDQFGWALADLIPGAARCVELGPPRDGVVSVLLPAALLAERDPLPESWAVTSDSIAAWVAGDVGAERLVLLKPVAGLYRSWPPEGEPIARLTSTSSPRCEPAGVDEHLPAALRAAGVETWVIGGRDPARLVELLDDGPHGRDARGRALSERQRRLGRSGCEAAAAATSVVSTTAYGRRDDTRRQRRDDCRLDHPYGWSRRQSCAVAVARSRLLPSRRCRHTGAAQTARSCRDPRRDRAPPSAAPRGRRPSAPRRCRRRWRGPPPGPPPATRPPARSRARRRAPRRPAPPARRLRATTAARGRP